jgi:aarF domain-containing kinase
MAIAMRRRRRTALAAGLGLWGLSACCEGFVPPAGGVGRARPYGSKLQRLDAAFDPSEFLAGQGLEDGLEGGLEALLSMAKASMPELEGLLKAVELEGPIRAASDALTPALESLGMPGSPSSILMDTSFGAQMAGPMAEVQSRLLSLGLPDDVSEAGAAAAALISLGSAATAAAAVAGAVSGPSPVLPTTFDLPGIERYYNSKPALLLARLANVSTRMALFAFSLWRDRATGQWEANMPKRAEKVRQIVQETGPAFIKIGQGISVRPDILPEPYLLELQKLQDQVPPFSSQEARDLVERELGLPLEQVFESASSFERPIAAASLGQVYRARLRESGEEVAVKVQRPAVLESVTLDLYVIRIILKTLAKVPSIRESSLGILGVIDNWAFRFIEELDYVQEAKNGDRFREDMGKIETLGSAIIVPKVYTSMVSRYLLVSEWVVGERVSGIDGSTVVGRQRLDKIVATLLNAYLAQLLETGFLHADPHPGNFLVTAEGKLVILDYGLMTEVTEGQRYALLSYVSNLLAKDYEATLEDLIALGFINKDIGEDPKKRGIVAPLLAQILEQLSNGGGAKALTVEEVGEEVQQLGKEYPLIIPQWFGLIIRAFSALEGLGLQNDGQYSIVKNCFPYLARRLLTEDSEKMHSLLRKFLYGKDGKYLNVDRVDEIISGYSEFTALANEASGGLDLGFTASTSAPSGASSLQGEGGFAVRSSGLTYSSEAAPAREEERRDPLSDPVARDALKLLFSREGNYVQDLVVEELVRMTDAVSREVALQAFRVLDQLSRAPLSPVSVTRALASLPLNPLLVPFQLSAKAQVFAVDRVSSRLRVAFELSDDDQESITTLRRIFEIFSESQKTNAALPAMGAVARRDPLESIRLAQQIPSLLSLIGPGANSMIQRYLVQLTTRGLSRLAQDLDSGELESASRRRPAFAPPRSED